MSRKPDYSKKIIKILGEKAAISLPALSKTVREQAGLPELSEQISDQNESEKPNYAITRSLKGLREAGLVEHLSSGQNEYARLTKEGRKKMYSLKLQNEQTLVSTVWDGFWRMIILDLPEERKNERESLRYLLKKAGFICLKNSVWVSHYPFEHLFMNIKKDLGLTTEMIVLVTDKLDETTEILLLENFRK